MLAPCPAIQQRWEPDSHHDLVLRDLPARHRFGRQEGLEDELAVIEARLAEWDGQADGDEDELDDLPGYPLEQPASGKTASGLVWKRRVIPASRLPELLARNNGEPIRKEPKGKNAEARERWHKAKELATEGKEMDRTLRRVRDLTKKVQQFMFYTESEASVAKLQTMLAQYHHNWDTKRYGRLASGLNDISRLAYPIENLIDVRTFECHDVVQQELGMAVQNELTRRAEPMELQRWQRETDNVLQQSEVSKQSVTKQLADLEKCRNRTSSEARSFLRRCKEALQLVVADINEFNTTHANLKKAEKDYKAEMFEQQRRNDGYKEQAEKQAARRKLAETRLQSDLDTARSEYTILKRSVGTLKKMYEENRTRANEISSWLLVLSGQKLEKYRGFMLENSLERIARREAMFKRLRWLELKRLEKIIEQQSGRLNTGKENLWKARLQKEVRVHRKITAEAMCLLLEMQARCKELHHGALPQDALRDLAAGTSLYQGFFESIVQELHAQADWLRTRGMPISISPQLTMQGSARLATPTSLLQVSHFLMHQREVQTSVIRELRRSSQSMSHKVGELTKRFTLKLLNKGPKAEDSFSEDSSEEEKSGRNPNLLQQILDEDHPDFLTGQHEARSPEVAAAAAQLQLLEMAKEELNELAATLPERALALEQLGRSRSL
ncbi:unnamed protein product [Effrenium voratum]|nr:unnamed protein product [Effrenium voratum]